MALVSRPVAPLVADPASRRRSGLSDGRPGLARDVAVRQSRLGPGGRSRGRRGRCLSRPRPDRPAGRNLRPRHAWRNGPGRLRQPRAVRHVRGGRWPAVVGGRLAGPPGAGVGGPGRCARHGQPWLRRRAGPATRSGRCSHRPQLPAATGRRARSLGRDPRRGRNPAGSPIVLYHGGLRPGRGIRQLAEAMLEPGLERAHLAFLGFGPSRGEAEELAAEPRFGGRIHVLGPVPPMDVVAWVASVDVAAMPIQAHSQSYYLSTPNKMFEAFAAGVPVVASDFPGMRGHRRRGSGTAARRAVRPGRPRLDRSRDPDDRRAFSGGMGGTRGSLPAGRRGALELGDGVGPAGGSLRAPGARRMSGDRVSARAFRLRSAPRSCCPRAGRSTRGPGGSRARSRPVATRSRCSLAARPACRTTRRTSPATGSSACRSRPSTGCRRRCGRSRVACGGRAASGRTRPPSRRALP